VSLLDTLKGGRTGDDCVRGGIYGFEAVHVSSGFDYLIYIDTIAQTFSGLQAVKVPNLKGLSAPERVFDNPQVAV
jgi:hypothetical protein